MRCFLWSQGNSGKSNSKVAWEVVCLPKDEGGLGIRRLDSFNKALMAAHIWKLLNKKNSLWVTWIHIHKINDRNFWDIPCRGNMSWAWRKVLQLRHIIRKFIWHKIGDGQRTFDLGMIIVPLDPLAEVVSYRDIHRAGLLPSSKYCCSFITAELWIQMEWKSSMVVIQPFSARVVWNSIRPHDNKVDWFYVVWFPGCIPRHAFNLWLVVKKKLKTQDRLASWNVNASLATHCTLCDLFLMLERNDRLFKKGKNTVDHVIGSIKSSVRLKLLSCRFKKSKAGLDILKQWNISEALLS
ncbi:CASP-like protein 4A3 [Tanacetum coccineum]